MNDIRRTILWVIFGFSMVLLWDQWQVYNGHKATFFPSATQSAKAPAADAAPAPAGSTAGSSVPAPQAANASPATPGAVPTGAPSTATSTTRERVVVSTDVLTLTFDSEGGTLVHSAFSKYKAEGKKDEGFVLLDESTNRVYVAQTGLIGSSALPTHKTPMAVVPGDRALKDGQDELQVKFESADVGGVKLVKTYTLKRGAYDIAVRHDIVNIGTAAVSPQLYMQLVRDGNKPPGESSFYSTFTGPAIYTEAKKYQKIEFKDIEKGKVEVEKTATNGYIAMVQHYFASAWILGDGIKRDLFERKVDNNLYAVGMIT